MTTLPGVDATSAENWCRIVIAQLIEAQRSRYDRDKARGIDSFRMLSRPEPGADEQEIRDAEALLGVHFDRQYTQWLRCVNGWESLCGTDDLFALDQFIHDSGPVDDLRDLLEQWHITPGLLGIESFDRLIVVGGSLQGLDKYIAIMAARDSDTASMPVYTFADGGYTEYADFATFIRREIEILGE